MSPACETVASVLSTVTDATEAAYEAAMAAAGSEVSTDGIEDPFALIAKAARGDIDAQRTAADMALHFARCGNDPNPLATLSEGLLLARMAACRGDQADIMRVIYLLSLAGSTCADVQVPEFAGEMLALFEILAERGDENAAMILASSAENETAETIEAAKHFKSRITAAWSFE